MVTLNYTPPTIADAPEETVFILEMNVIYVSTATIETITFEVSLEYCQCIWSPVSSEPVVFEQATMVSQLMVYNFNKVN